jgi:L-ascorbate metabolism protein UlaG (beta-lactamase superfamily)
VKVVTDPHDGKSIGLPKPQVKADVVLVSHEHFDHNATGVVTGPDTTVIVDPIMTVEKGVRIEGFRAAHDQEGGAKRGRITVFRFELDGFSFCHLGDIGHLLDESQVDRIAPVDFLFVPVGDVFTIGPQAAKDTVERVAPKVAVPMHYRVPGLGLSIKPVQSFLTLCKQSQIVKVGNEVEFSADDMAPDGTEIWVFSP